MNESSKWWTMKLENLQQQLSRLRGENESLWKWTENRRMLLLKYRNGYWNNWNWKGFEVEKREEECAQPEKDKQGWMIIPKSEKKGGKSGEWRWEYSRMKEGGEQQPLRPMKMKMKLTWNCLRRRGSHKFTLLAAWGLRPADVWETNKGAK